VRSNHGAAYSRLGRYEEAIAEYKQALAYDSRNATIRFNLALAYYKSAAVVEAADEFTKFLGSSAADHPQRLNAVLLLAECQVRLGDYQKAIDALSPLAEANPTHRVVAFVLGSAFIGDGQLNRGQAIIDKVFRNEDSAQSHLLLGSVLFHTDDVRGALREFERTIQMDSKLPTAQAWYGRALMRIGDPTKAKAAFKAELAENKNDFEANLFTGILLRQDKQLAEAFQYLARAVQLRPRDEQACYNLAAVYAAQGKPNDALPLLEGVVRENPDFSEARLLLVSVYYRLNRKADGDREKAEIHKLSDEKRAKQSDSQNHPDQVSPSKPPDNFKHHDRFKEE
jgi:tetratricopeptide (TPR) repeat protein